MKLTEEQAERLVEEYADLLLRTAYSWTGNLADAQDACQTALLKLIVSRRQFDGPEGQKAWLLRVTINECKSLNRSAWRRRRADWEVAALAAQMPEPEPDGLLEAVQKLPPKYRTAIFLRYYEGYGVGEIAQMIGVKPALVSTWLARGREKLKMMLGGEMDESLPETDG